MLDPKKKLRILYKQNKRYYRNALILFMIEGVILTILLFFQSHYYARVGILAILIVTLPTILIGLVGVVENYLITKKRKESLANSK